MTTLDEYLRPPTRAPRRPQTASPTTVRSATAYARKALTDEANNVASAQEGYRNDTLNRAAFNLGQLVGAGALDEALVWESLRPAALKCGLELTQVHATIASGLRAGREEPRDLTGVGQITAPRLTVLTDVQERPQDAADAGRVLSVQSAADIAPARVLWLWDGRLALGTLALLAGREGVGKSTVAYWIAARVTRGELPGEHVRRPRSVLVVATEDSWAHTIVPRLMAAGADLSRVFRVEVTCDGSPVGLQLVRDNARLAAEARQRDASLLLFDPLMSRLGALDTHKDAEVRQALEPLAAMAEANSLTVLGLIHHNKSGSGDALDVVMGSKGFVAVARTVLTVLADPDDDTGARRLLGLAKNNLGRSDLPLLSFTITGYAIDTANGRAITGQLVWGEEVNAPLADAMSGNEDRTAVGEAADWLKDYLTSQGGTASSADCKRAGSKVGHNEAALQRARKKLHLAVTTSGFPRASWWELPGTQIASHGSEHRSQNHDTTATTAMTDEL